MKNDFFVIGLIFTILVTFSVNDGASKTQIGTYFIDVYCLSGMAFNPEGKVYVIQDELKVTIQIKNTIDRLLELVDTGTPAADKLEDAIAKLDTALDELNKAPPDNLVAVENIECAVGYVEATVKDGYLDPEEGTQLMDRLAQAARRLAWEAIERAIDQVEVHLRIVEAHKSLEEGDALREVGKFREAVNKYKDALSKVESEFLSLWKYADPGIAEVDARKRLAGLKS